MNGKLDSQVNAVRAYLLERYAGDFHRKVTVREFLLATTERHLRLELGDPNFAGELCSGDEARYWQRLSEVLLANELVEVGLPVRPSRNGPDFLIDLDGRRIGNMKPMAVIHNPGATNPLPVGLLPAQDEFIATAKGPDEYVLERIDGRSAPRH